MNIGFKKAVISIGTAVVMLTSVFAGSVVASSTNEITVSPSSSTVKPGESFDVSVGYEAGTNGASGFQLFLHYDDELLDVYVPSTSELSGKYDVGSRFSVITNYSYGEGVVKIVGANMSANNITVDTALSLVSFKAKSGVSGTAKIWIEVEKLVENKDGSMVSTPYSAPTSSSPIKVKISAPTTTTTTTTPTTTTTTTTTPTSTTTTTTSQSTTTPTTTTATEPTTTTTSKVTTPTTTTTTSKATTTTTTTSKPATTTTTAASSEAEGSTSISTTTSATTTTTLTSTQPTLTSSETQLTSDTPVTTVSETVTTTTSASATSQQPSEPSEDAIVIENDGDALYELSQGAEAYDETKVDPYCVDLRDYIEDFEQNYNVKVTFTADGYASGSISMNDIDGNWTKYYQNTDQPVWEAQNISLDKNDALVFVQLFYLKENSTFTIESIEITPYEPKADSNGDTTEDLNDTNVTIPEDQKNDNISQEDIENAVENMPENDNNPQTDDNLKSVKAVGLVVLEVLAMAGTLFFLGKNKEVEEPVE